MDRMDMLDWMDIAHNNNVDLMSLLIRNVHLKTLIRLSVMTMKKESLMFWDKHFQNLFPLLEHKILVHS